MSWFQAWGSVVLLGGLVAASGAVAQSDQAAKAPGSLAEASSFFKAPPLDGCRIAFDDLIKGGSKALRGQWFVQKGPGETGLPVGGRVDMQPLPQRAGEVLTLRFRNGRLVADSAVSGVIPIGVLDRAPPEPGTGLRAESVGRGDLADGAEVFLDELGVGRLPCGVEQMLQLRLQSERDTGTGDVLRQDIRLFLIDQTRMSGTYRETGPGGRLERGVISLMRR
ncbi:hypothetical protein VWZ88_14390 [Phaeobacter sp. JH20_36]|uniref:hypothetical protein n=1 Tax=unclassified Phaeobacter TaxID=2621772 RepID=UPI003A8AD367